MPAFVGRLASVAAMRVPRGRAPCGITCSDPTGPSPSRHALAEPSPSGPVVKVLIVDTWIKSRQPGTRLSVSGLWDAQDAGVGCLCRCGLVWLRYLQEQSA